MLVVGLAGCSSQPAVEGPSAEAKTSDSPLPLVLSLPGYPLSTEARPTTSGQVFRSNLEARIAQIDARADADTPTVLAMRATSHFQHYQNYGALQELDLAAELARRAAKAGPEVVDALLIHAHVSAYLHEFEAADAALFQAAKLNSRAKEMASIRAEIDEALGRGAAPTTQPPTEWTDAGRATSHAHHCLQMGDLDCASVAFHQAQFLDNDTSPLPLTWLHTQQGIALLRFGHPRAAIPFFRAALARLPDYYVALEHLAECLGQIGEFVESRDLYERVIAQTGNPEFMAGFAAMLRRAGDPEAAAAWQQRAQTGYAELLQKHPATYAQHAIHFYLDSADSSTALRLAETNIGIRQDVGSWILLAEAAVAHHDCSRAAEALRQADASGWRPPERTEVAAQVASCR